MTPPASDRDDDGEDGDGRWPRPDPAPGPGGPLASKALVGLTVAGVGVAATGALATVLVAVLSVEPFAVLAVIGIGFVATLVGAALAVGARGRRWLENPYW